MGWAWRLSTDGSLGAFLERSVHRVEALSGRIEQSRSEERHEESRKPLRLMEAASRATAFDAETVLAIEQARHEKTPQPSQLLLLDRRDDGRVEGHRRAPRRLDARFQLGSRTRSTGDADNERVPVGISVEAGQHLPNALGRSADIDRGFNYAHEFFCLSS